ncbi:MAG TPA: methylaspartate mutase subunit E, partial [Phycisphaerae bacterium]|nr:methylaspartate mutase subunit E [Phycisphaerae bacterium]
QVIQGPIKADETSVNAHSYHTIVLGGIGGDSHSVGLIILNRALVAQGYQVHFLGIQNRIEDFFSWADGCDLVMISNMDGHAKHYLRGFSGLLQQYAGHRPLWYLGGNLSVGDARDGASEFLQMGFDRVFSEFTDVQTVIKIVKKDLAGTKARNAGHRHIVRLRPDDQAEPRVLGQPMDAREFDRQRCDVLAHWSTGRGAADLADNAAFLARQPSLARVQSLVHSGDLPILIQPRSGVPLVQDQIGLFQAFKAAGVRVLSYQVDSYTRNNRYADADEAIQLSAARGRPTMNGFPVVNHGVAGLRQVINAVGVPLQTRHSTRDPRLLAEISYAGGVSSFEGGAICYNIPYYKDYPVEDSIRAWQYVDRLTGLYAERYGLVLDREFFGVLTATLVPPSLAIAIDVLEAELAIREGVRCVSLGYAEQGHRSQDIAAMRVLRELGDELQHRYRDRAVQVGTVFHQYMAAFPRDLRQAEELIYQSAITATLSKATRVLIKSPVEPVRIPTVQDNVRGIELVSRAVSAASDASVDEEAIATEMFMIHREVSVILDSVRDIGEGNLASGICRAFREGLLDVPFSPSVHNRGAVLTARDAEGAVRFLSAGRLALGRDQREYHREKMAKRLRQERMRFADTDFLLIEQDVMRIGRGEHGHWPLDRREPADDTDSLSAAPLAGTL